LNAARGLLLAAAVAGLAVLTAPAHAGPVVDRIRTEGAIRCGGVSRPGLLGRSGDGRAPSGLYLDLCRAIGAALLPPDGRIAFHPYDDDAAFARMRDGHDDLAFLDGAEILEQRLAGRTLTGPVVAFVSTGVRVQGGSPAEGPADLAGKSVCFYQGSRAHRTLEAFMASRHLDFVRMPFTEYGEMDDAFAARKCDAEAGETGDLAIADLAGASASAARGAGGGASRVLPAPLATFPVFAVTPASDPQWAEIVAWAIVVLQRADLAPGPWMASPDMSAPAGADLGLADDWAKRVLAAAGRYKAIFERNISAPLALPRGPNAPAEAGGLFVTPSRD